MNPHNETIYDLDRDEHDSCECGTPGCPVDHTRSPQGTSCDTW